ncbi:MAG: GNAT family N-acetyltransferase [Myxococcales bacterium]|nr:GNAT family N-acetyltransferase [Myxococcales bacterium]HRC57122.1 GNAT family N-acetyltransferase [Kofleriaceae bacterium]
MRGKEIAATVRLAGHRDAASLTRLINRAYEVEQFFVEGERTSQEEVAAMQECGRFFVLDCEGGHAAAVYVRTDGEQAQLQMLSVSPEHQGQGLGTRLVAVAEAFCRALGCRAMGLQIVNLRDELGTWYRRLGYQETQAVPYVDRQLKRPCHFIQMSKALAS